MKYFLLAVTVSFLIGCESTSTTPDGDKMVDLTELRQDIAKHTVSDLILPAYEELSQKAELLNEAAITFGDNPTENTLSDLKQTHQEVWNSWQKTALFYYGPAVNNGLRAGLNTYPVDDDKVEANITSGIYQLGSLGNQDAEGLPALDYLLNNEMTAAPLAEFSEERLNYIKALTNRIHQQVSATQDEWINGVFTQQFTGTDATGTDVGSALGLIINGIDLHFQRFVRDGKVAIPAGIRSAREDRPKLVEARYGRYSTQLLKTSLRAYQAYFKGTSTTRSDGPSILAYLREIEHADLADQIENHFDILLDKVDRLDTSIVAQIENDNQAMIDVFYSMQDLVAIFKTDMASVMGISITNQDNDGD